LNPTTANPLLMPDTPAIVGFCEKVWERIPREEWEEGIGRWCSGGAQWGHDLSMGRSLEKLGPKR
jgi:hypothetical protein